jgi:glycosyltransferase involved in cell wall biosynthesis
MQSLLAMFIGWRLSLRYKPSLIWIYNPYLFEVLFLIGAKFAGCDCPMVLELEDLPRARNRPGLGPLKNLLDEISLRVSLFLIHGASIVQPSMRGYFRRHQIIWDLPVLLTVPLTADPTVRTTCSTVGYFGGLSKEKGVGRLLAVARMAPSVLNWEIAGSGPMACDVAFLAGEFPERIIYHGTLTSKDFERLYSELDVVVNLHDDISLFGGGVFPYKLLEAVAAGKIVLSVEMKGCPPEVDQAIFWLSGDAVKSCVEALSKIDVIERDTRMARVRAQRWVLVNYNAVTFVERVLRDLKFRSEGCEELNAIV